jgi:hypothetical protein
MKTEVQSMKKHPGAPLVTAKRKSSYIFKMPIRKLNMLKVNYSMGLGGEPIVTPWTNAERRRHQ